MSSEWAIRVHNLSKTYLLYDRPSDRGKQWILPAVQKCLGREPAQYYREVHAVENVSFEVKKGETLGIIGRNGSGKSTLLQLIVGTLSTTGGTIEIDGRVAALLELGCPQVRLDEATAQADARIDAAVAAARADALPDFPSALADVYTPEHAG